MSSGRQKWSKLCSLTTYINVTPSILSVPDSLCSLVLQPLIRVKEDLPNWNNYRLIISVSCFLCLTYLSLWIKPLIMDKQNKTGFALLSYNWLITHPFMTHDLFITSRQCPGGVPLPLFLYESPSFTLPIFLMLRCVCEFWPLGIFLLYNDAIVKLT